MDALDMLVVREVPLEWYGVASQVACLPSLPSSGSLPQPLPSTLEDLNIRLHMSLQLCLQFSKALGWCSDLQVKTIAVLAESIDNSHLGHLRIEGVFYGLHHIHRRF